MVANSLTKFKACSRSVVLTSRSRSTGRRRTDPNSTARAFGKNWKKFSAVAIRQLAL